MKITQVPVDKCIVPEVRVTAAYDDELQALLSDTTDSMGQLQPITVIKDGETYIVTDGKHRLQEAIRKGREKIDAVVYEGDAKKALLQNLVMNRVRGKTKASEMVLVINSLYSDYKLDIEEIQKETGFKRDYIERLIKISEAAPLVQALLDEEIIGVGAAFEIARLPRHEQQEELASQTQIYRWTVPYLKENVDQILHMMQNPEETQPHKDPPPPRVYRCEVCREVTPIERLKPVAVCPECYSSVYRFEQQRKLKLQEQEDSEKK